MRVRDYLYNEFKSTASVSFFLVLALTVGSAAAWFEGGASKHAAAQANILGTSTTEANLPK